MIFHFYFQENFKQNAKAIDILPEAKKLSINLKNNFDDNDESISKKETNEKIYKIEQFSRKSYHSETENEFPMQVICIKILQHTDNDKLIRLILISSIL